MWGPSSSRSVKLLSRNARLRVASCTPRREGRGAALGEGRAGTWRECPAVPPATPHSACGSTPPGAQVSREPLPSAPPGSPLRLDLRGGAASGPAPGPARPANARWLPELARARPTGPCLSLSSLSCGTWHPHDAPAPVAPVWSAPTRCASRPAQRATQPDSRSWAAATASSRRGPPRTRGATSAVTSSGASCARACSARVSSGPSAGERETGGQRAAQQLRVRLRGGWGWGGWAAPVAGPIPPPPSPVTVREERGTRFISATLTAPAPGAQQGKGSCL